MLTQAGITTRRWKTIELFKQIETIDCIPDLYAQEAEEVALAAETNQAGEDYWI